MQDMTPEELKNYSELEAAGLLDDPDQLGIESTYQWDEEYCRYVLGMLVNDISFLISSNGLVKPSYFPNEVHRFVCKFVFDHHEKYNTLPKRVYVNQAVEDYIKEKSDAIKVFWRGEVNTVYKYYVPGVQDRDYLLDRITEFAKEQAVKIAVIDVTKEVMKKDDKKWARIHKIMQAALSVERNFDIGLDYFQTVDERYARIMEAAAKGDIFITGFESIDKKLQGGGMIRGEIGAVIGTPGQGKSVFLVKCCCSNLKKHKILYVSLELDRDRLAERFDSMLTHYKGFGINNLVPNREEVKRALSEYVDGFEDKRRLIIKQFPSREMDVPTFLAFYHQIKMRGFQPDLVIVDWIGEMKDYPDMPTWESRFRIVGDLRGFAKRENVCVLVALQADKSSKALVREGQLIDEDNLADAYGQSRPLDCFWSINRRQADYECETARIRVIKHRAGEHGHHFHISFDKKTLWMDEITESSYRERVNKWMATQNISKDELDLENKIRDEKRKKADDKKKKKPKPEDPDVDPSNPEQ